MTILILGDQLTVDHGPLVERPDERVLMIEARSFAERLPYHPHKLTLVFSAMRHFRDALEASGRRIEYRTVETFAEGLDEHLSAYPTDVLTVMRPSSYGAAGTLRDLVEAKGRTLRIVDNPLFLCSSTMFDNWRDGREPPYRQEGFYRFMRRETGYLMNGDDPVGGTWNYDEQNREVPDEGHDPPEPPRFEPDELTRSVREWVQTDFDGGYDDRPSGGSWADPVDFRWPVTRAQALVALEAFVENRLAMFGPYQDAMVAGEWAMNHSLLAPALNLGLLHPAEVIETAIEAARDDPEIPLNSLEGFVRQILGWREFMRHVYRTTMPELTEANQLDATEDLPAFYWTGQTGMACLADTIDSVRRRGYSHHIQRLMILSNFALLYGVEPSQLNRWFQAAYVDAFHWVTTPNVVEMGSYAAGVFASKPYAASANYLDRMSDYCGGCRYDPHETTGESACPFNALYWTFLDHHEDRLRGEGRMGLVYAHLDDKDMGPIADRADTIRDAIDTGDL